MKGGMVVVLVAALLMAAILPSAITTLSATPARTFTHTEVADDAVGDESIGPVAQLPVIVNTSTVTVDDGTGPVNCPLTTCYTVVLATGIYTILDAFVNVGDTVDIRYQSLQDFTGIIGVVYDNLPVFLVIGAMLLVLGWFGVTKGINLRGGGLGGI